MKLKDAFDFVDSRWGSSHGFWAEKQKQQMRDIVKNFGEGFAVFVGSSLVYFCSDKRGAIGEARNTVASGISRDSVSVKRIVV